MVKTPSRSNRRPRTWSGRPSTLSSLRTAKPPFRSPCLLADPGRRGLALPQKTDLPEPAGPVQCLGEGSCDDSGVVAEHTPSPGRPSTGRTVMAACAGLGYGGQARPVALSRSREQEQLAYGLSGLDIAVCLGGIVQRIGAADQDV